MPSASDNMLDDSTIAKVWLKGIIGQGYDADTWRKDVCGSWMKSSEHGNRDSQYGWEVDHIKPKSKGGGDELDNLRPLQWENNVSRQDGRLSI